MSYLIRRVLAKPCLALDEMCRFIRKVLVLFKTRLIFPRINGPNVSQVKPKIAIMTVSTED